MRSNMAYDDGEAAYNRGESHGDNPHRPGTLKHFDWGTAMGEGATERRMKEREQLVKRLAQD